MNLGLIITIAVGVAVSALTIYASRTRPPQGRFLCDDCRFNDPDSCHKVERPHAVECTSYRSTTGDSTSPTA